VDGQTLGIALELDLSARSAISEAVHTTGDFLLGIYRQATIDFVLLEPCKARQTEWFFRWSRGQEPFSYRAS
jgi:hypothetical protein